MINSYELDYRSMPDYIGLLDCLENEIKTVSQVFNKLKYVCAIAE